MNPRPATRARNAASQNALATATTETPLGYALRVMRDDNAPMNLRTGMARAALPYLHARVPAGEPPAPPEPPMPELSRIEIARRIAFLLDGMDEDAAESSIAHTPQACAVSAPASEFAPPAPAMRAPAAREVNYIFDEVRPDQVLPRFDGQPSRSRGR